MIIIRRFKKDEGEALLEVFLSSVRNIASRDYNPEQIRAWIPGTPESVQQLIRHINVLSPFVAEVNHRIIGYADLQNNGLIDHFYVSGGYVRQGVGSRLMAEIEKEARNSGLHELTSFVSLTAEPFFLHHGFRIVRRCFPVRHGVMLPNALMRKV